MILTLITSMILPAIITVLVPVAILLFAMSRDIKVAIKEALYLNLIFMALVTILLQVVVSLVPAVGTFIVYTTDFVYNSIVGLLAGLSYIGVQLITRRRVDLKDKRIWLIALIVMMAKFIIPMIFPTAITMAVI